MKYLQRGSVVVVVLLLVAAVATTPAFGSAVIARNAKRATLTIDSHGRAHVSYYVNGRKKVVLAWGAINANAPSTSQAQVTFKFHHGGSAAGGVCLPYHGPRLAWLVKACKAPDGSYWALQSWQRLMPNHGGSKGAWELHLSHWTGPLAKLAIHQDWIHNSIRHIFGKLTYGGHAVYGFRSTSHGVPLDSYGRNIYVDTFNSHYGKGWRRENSFLTHNPTGTFCYGFYSKSGKGTKYRATVEGPGVTPDVMWHGKDIGRYKARVQKRMQALERSWGDPKCRS